MRHSNTTCAHEKNPLHVIDLAVQVIFYEKNIVIAGTLDSGAAEQGSPGSPWAPLFQDIWYHFQKYKAKGSMINGSKVIF